MKYMKLFENISTMEKWPTRSYAGHGGTRVQEPDTYFIYQLRPEQRSEYLNIWFIGSQYFSKSGQTYTDEVLTLKETDQATSDHLYRRQFNCVSITILCPTGAKFKKDKRGSELYNMKAQIHSVDDSSYGIWWNDVPLNRLKRTRESLMEWINPSTLHPAQSRYFPINGEEFLDKCVELGADEKSKDYN